MSPRKPTRPITCDTAGGQQPLRTRPRRQAAQAREEQRSRTLDRLPGMDAGRDHKALRGVASGARSEKPGRRTCQGRRRRRVRACATFATQAQGVAGRTERQALQRGRAPPRPRARILAERSGAIRPKHARGGRGRGARLGNRDSTHRRAWRVWGRGPGANRIRGQQHARGGRIESTGGPAARRRRRTHRKGPLGTPGCVLRRRINDLVRSTRPCLREAAASRG